MVEAESVLQAELDATDQLIQIEPKHYNAWSHRLYIARRFGLLNSDSELDFTAKFIELDVRNNSAWSYRRYVFADHDVEKEIQFCLSKLRLSPSNESVWVYLRSLKDWQNHSDVESLCMEYVNGIKLSPKPIDIVHYRDVLDTAVQIFKSRGEHDSANQFLNLLKQGDHIRERLHEAKIASIIY